MQKPLHSRTIMITITLTYIHNKIKMITCVSFCPTGAVYYYTLLQTSIWWLCHMIIIFWNIRFPFHANKNLRTKPIHVAMVLLALLLPTIPVIASFSTGGFVINGNPPTLCVSRSSDAAYYSLVLPISIIMATGVSLLVMVIIIVIKVQPFIPIPCLMQLLLSFSIAMPRITPLQPRFVLVHQKKNYYFSCAIMLSLDHRPL